MSALNQPTAVCSAELVIAGETDDGLDLTANPSLRTRAELWSSLDATILNTDLRARERVVTLRALHADAEALAANDGLVPRIALFLRAAERDLEAEIECEKLDARESWLITAARYLSLSPEEQSAEDAHVAQQMSEFLADRPDIPRASLPRIRYNIRSFYRKELARSRWPELVDPDASLEPALQVQSGRSVSNLTNAAELLNRQRTLQIWLDEFSRKILVQWPEDSTLRPLADADVARVQVLLQRSSLTSVGPNTVHDAIRLVASQRPTDAVRVYLDSLTWDGKRRLSRLMSRGFGTPADRYHIRAGRNLLLGMVARAYRPGCQVDEALVLEGAQGTLKSSAWRVLGGEWFAELTANPNSKDFEQQLQNVWLGEFSELNALRRVEDIARLKQFLTNRVDHLRFPYDRTVSDLPRRTILCGSTNESDWLHDPTGGRRFIPVRVGAVDLTWLRENRDQLFAEAAELFRAGRKWHVYPREAALAEQQSRAPEDPWLTPVRDYLCGRTEITEISEVLLFALRVPLERQTKASSTRVGIVLRTLGCKQLPQRRFDGRRVRPWLVPEEFAQRPVISQGPVAFAPAAERGQS